MSDPTVIPDAEVPRSIKDLGNPKWRGNTDHIDFALSPDGEAAVREMERILQGG